MQTIKKYSIDITLEDDLHTGSGIGNSQVDSFQARDRHGNPVITRQHFKGVFVSTAQAWLKDKFGSAEPEYSSYIGSDDNTALSDIESNHTLATTAIKQLTDEAYSENSGIHLVFGSCYKTTAPFSSSDDQLDSSRPGSDDFLIWGSSARGKNKDPLNRAPKDNTLRSVEFVRAGTCFRTEITLFAPGHLIEAYSGLLEKLLRRIDRLGAKRNRGAGGVSMQIHQLAPDSASLKRQVTDKGALSLTFYNTEPMRLPSTQMPGNIIPTETYVSSSRLRGALANWIRLIQTGDEDKGNCLFNDLINIQDTENGIFISDALPIPAPTPDSNIQAVLPWPQSLQLTKSIPSQQRQDSTLPWWFTGAEKEIRDTLYEKPEEGESFKRNKSAVYLIKTNKGWAQHKQDTAIHMRNSVRTPSLNDDDDSKLFSEEVLPEYSYFRAEITFQNGEMQQQFLALAEKAISLTIPLTLGRGKAPCHVESICDADQPLVNHEWAQDESLTLLLTSDWLIYNPATLRPYEHLDLQVLNTAFDLQLTDADIRLLEQHCESRSENKKLTGFNFASNLPKRPVGVIAAGSVIQLGKSLPESLKQKLNQAFKMTSQVGDRTLQGMGGYWCYSNKFPLTKTLKSAAPDCAPINHTEHLLRQVDELLQDKQPTGSRSQWQAVLSYVQNLQLRQAPTGLLQGYLQKLFKPDQHQQTQGKIGFREDNNQAIYAAWENVLTGDDNRSQYNPDIYAFSLHLLKAVIGQLNKTGNN